MAASFWVSGVQGFPSLRTSPLPNPPAPFKGEVCRRSATLGGACVFPVGGDLAAVFEQGLTLPEQGLMSPEQGLTSPEQGLTSPAY